MPEAAQQPMGTPPLDLSHHFSLPTTRRQASAVKKFYKYFQVPGIHNLAGGLPHVSYFPFDTLEAAVAHPNRFKPTPLVPVDPPADGQHAQSDVSSQPASARLKVPKESSTTDILKKIDLTTALQYGLAQGYPPLRLFIREFVREHLHPNVPYAEGPEVILTNGSTDGFSKTLDAFSNVWNEGRDWIGAREGLLCENFTYMNAIQNVQPRGLNVVGVAIDAEGMLATGKGGLEDVLENWDYSRGRRPHLMYTITIGQNPTGATMSVPRRKEIYALCQKYDIIIIEDDPYWNLQYPSAASSAARYRGEAAVRSDMFTQNYNAHGRSSGYDFLDSLVPSYLSVDTDGRVVRLDTFSKTIAPGCRLGWVTAQPAIVEKLLRITETTTQQPSGFVQSMVAQLIAGQQAEGQALRAGDPSTTSSWKMDGWVRWLEGLRGGYERRMQDMCETLENGKTLVLDSTDESNQRPSSDLKGWEVVDKVQLYDFVWPMGGMFVWIKVNIESHPLRSRYSAERLCTALWFFLTKEPYMCVIAPGWLFSPTPEVAAIGYPYFRLCFAPMDAGVVREATEKVVLGFHAFWKVKEIDDPEEESIPVGFAGPIV